MLRYVTAALAGIFCMANASANDHTFRVIPSQPIAGQPFKIRVIKPLDPCGIPLPTLIEPVDLGAGVIRYAIPGYDFCEPQSIPAQDISYDVPALSAGTYTFQFAICGLFPVDCHTLEERTVTVLGQGNIPLHMIPTISSLGAVSLAILVTLAGTVLRPRDSR